MGRRGIVGGLGLRAWQIQVSDRRGHVLATGVLESSNQTDSPLATTEFVPWKPKAVGRPQCGFALVLGHHLSREDEFLLRRRIVGIWAVVVECIDGQTTIDLDWSLLPIRVEHQAAAKSAHGRFARLVQRCVRPHGGNAVWSLWPGIWYIDRQTVAQIKFRTSTQRGDNQQPNGASHTAADVGVGTVRFLFVRVPVH